MALSKKWGVLMLGACGLAGGCAHGNEERLAEYAPQIQPLPRVGPHLRCDRVRVTLRAEDQEQANRYEFAGLSGVAARDGYTVHARAADDAPERCWVAVRVAHEASPEVVDLVVRPRSDAAASQDVVFRVGSPELKDPFRSTVSASGYHYLAVRVDVEAW